MSDRPSSDSRHRFLSSFRTGAIRIWLFMPSAVLYGMAFGIMAGTTGLTLGESGVFSAVVYAGGAQMGSLQGWAHPVPILFVCLTTAAINSRYVLMGATLRPFLAGRPAWQVYGTLFLLTDSTWIMAMRDRDEDLDGVGYVLGGGLTMWTMWIASSMAGQAFGQLIADPRAFGFDFMLAAFFSMAAVNFWRQSRNVAPLLIAAAVAILVQRLLPGPWYILIGALAGSLAGAIRYARAA